MKKTRAHRVGQKNEVKVIRLVTKHTIEEIFIKRALVKLHLTHSVIDQGKFSLDKELSAVENLSEVIKYGLEENVGDENSSFSIEDIDAILSAQNWYFIYL
eukprot:TRINITY_DN14073_c0_g1_i1.p1 TRINITY_DN14073_c0_g1~~TRINITY_DN14073_c0_g1_i1.p1  ORF type:complete len:101 (-),score=18.69 TRINITY_DN14073_c0_g1_i1:102-404(-)